MDLAKNLDYNSKKKFANLGKYYQILDLDYVLDNEEDTKLVLPNTISDIDISHWSIKSEDSVKVYNVKGVIIGSFISQRKAAKELGVSHSLVSRYGKSMDANLDLPNNKICAISSDFSQIVETFKSFKEAANYFDLPDYRRIRRYFWT